MKNFLFWASVVLIFIFWPTTFYLANRQDWHLYFFATIIVFIVWLAYIKNFKHHYFFYLLLPIVHPAFLFVPLFAGIFWIRSFSARSAVVYFALLMATFFLYFKPFLSISIFKSDPLVTDTLIKKINLVPSRNLARVYLNKTTPYFDKFESNIFESLDLNNYFFSAHPRELATSQNLIKFSLVAIIPFLIGLFLIPKSVHKNWLLGTSLSFILALGLINNQDKFESVLFFPVFFVCFLGLRSIMDFKKSTPTLFLATFTVLSILEYARVILKQ